MRQAASSGGNRAQRDKEFFPAGVSEVARAKSSSSGRSKSEGGRNALPSNETSERKEEGEEAQVRKKKASSHAASLLLSASTASTIPMASSSSEERVSNTPAPVEAVAKLRVPPVPAFSYKDALMTAIAKPANSAKKQRNEPGTNLSSPIKVNISRLDTFTSCCVLLIESFENSGFV